MNRASLRLAVHALLLAAAAGAQAAGRIEHVITYGQSLAVGQASVPVVTRVPRHDSLMFSGGVRSPFFVPDRLSSYSSLVPLVEVQEGFAGETPTAGTLEMINDLTFAESGVDFTRTDVRYLGSDPAVGGQTVAQLGFGTLPFYVLAENIWHGAIRSWESGSSYRVGAVTWAQGESDYSAGTTRSGYVAAVSTLHAWIDLYARAFSGQTTGVAMIAHQVSSHVACGSTYPGIALAQTDLAATRPGFYLAAPSYMMDFAPDGAHLTAISSKWLGAYFGLAYKRVVTDGKDWKPLAPVSAVSSGGSIHAKFRVPAPPLVFDTTQVRNPGNYGFTLISATGSEIPIGSIFISGADTVTLVPRRVFPAAAKLRYAFKGTSGSGRLTGPRGNLRDSQGDTLVFDRGGINKRMDNWSVIFEMDITR